MIAIVRILVRVLDLLRSPVLYNQVWSYNSSPIPQRALNVGPALNLQNLRINVQVERELALSRVGTYTSQATTHTMALSGASYLANICIAESHLSDLRLLHAPTTEVASRRSKSTN